MARPVSWYEVASMCARHRSSAMPRAMNASSFASIPSRCPDVSRPLKSDFPISLKKIFLSIICFVVYLFMIYSFKCLSMMHSFKCSHGRFPLFAIGHLAVVVIPVFSPCQLAFQRVLQARDPPVVLRPLQLQYLRVRHRALQQPHHPR